MSAELPETPTPLAEISQGPNAFEAFLDRNQKALFLFALVLALATAAFVVISGINKSKQETAGAAFTKADDISSLQAVATEHPGTDAAQSAQILLADRQWLDGKKDEAIQTLESFTSSNPKHPAAPSAKASLAAKWMSQGKTAEAVEVFQELVDTPGARYIAPFALISMGDIAKSAGDISKAEAAYQRVASDFSDSSFLQIANSRLADLKAKAPTVIQAEPVSETPAATPTIEIPAGISKP